jgi:hypothetical protein
MVSYRWAVIQGHIDKTCKAVSFKHSKFVNHYCKTSKSQCIVLVSGIKISTDVFCYRLFTKSAINKESRLYLCFFFEVC